VVTTDTRLSDARAPLPGSGSYIQNTTAQQPSSNFAIDGTGSANILSATTQFNIGGNRILSTPGSNTNLFAGIQAGGAAGGGIDNSFFGNGAGFRNSGSDNSFFGQN